MNDDFKRRVCGLFKDFVLTVSGKGTGDRQIDLRPTGADDKAYCFGELMFFEYLITTPNIIITNLAIGDENNVLIVLFDDFLGNK